jgi:hypothetical protein
LSDESTGGCGRRFLFAEKKAGEVGLIGSSFILTASNTPDATAGLDLA